LPDCSAPGCQPISVIIKDSISEGGWNGMVWYGMEFPARHWGAIKIAIFIIANGRWCKKCRLIGFHGRPAISAASWQNNGQDCTQTAATG